jgi:hypothetical protein
LSDAALVEAALMGVSFSPGDLLGVHVRSFALISCRMALRDDGLMTALLLLAMTHPMDIERLAFRATCRAEAHGFLGGEP